jgi:ribonuclease HI
MNITVFTDGSCITENNVCKYAGYGIYYPNGELENVSSPFTVGSKTNQRAELYAIYIAIKTAFNNLQVASMTIYTDSEYSIKSLTTWIHKWAKNSWKKADKKPVKNKDILEPLYGLVVEYGEKIRFIHVKAHTKKQDILSQGNAMADALAQRAAKESQKNDLGT